MRKEETDLFADRNGSNVLIMDDPFVAANAVHLLIPYDRSGAKGQCSADLPNRSWRAYYL